VRRFTGKSSPVVRFHAASILFHVVASLPITTRRDAPPH
jgi:hypothetical protein